MSKASTAQALPAPETREVEAARFPCDGSTDLVSLGHPRVFLTIGAEGFVDCPYCDRRYVLKAGCSGHHH